MQHLPVVDIRGLVNVVHRKCGLLYRYIYPYVAKVRNRGEGKRCDNLACARFFSTKWHFCCVGLLLARHVLYVSPHDSNFHVRRVREWSLDKLGIVKTMLQNTTGAENKHI